MAEETNSHSDEEKRKIIRREEIKQLNEINDKNYDLIYKVILSVCSLSLGGSSIMNLPEKANWHFLIPSWICFLLGLILVLTETFNSIENHENRIQAIQQNPHTPDRVDNTNCINILKYATFLSICGLTFLAISLLIGNESSNDDTIFIMFQLEK